MKKCIDCSRCVRAGLDYYYCDHSIQKIIDPMTGKESLKKPQSCASERLSTDKDACGANARFFQPINRRSFLEIIDEWLKKFVPIYRNLK